MSDADMDSRRGPAWVSIGAYFSASISSGQRHAFLETLSALSGAAVFGVVALRQEQTDREACPTAWTMRLRSSASPARSAPTRRW